MNTSFKLTAGLPSRSLLGVIVDFDCDIGATVFGTCVDFGTILVSAFWTTPVCAVELFCAVGVCVAIPHVLPPMIELISPSGVF